MTHYTLEETRAQMRGSQLDPDPRPEKVRPAPAFDSWMRNFIELRKFNQMRQTIENMIDTRGKEHVLDLIDRSQFKHVIRREASHILS